MNIVTKAVPWANWSEWRYVKSLLYSDDVSLQWEGIQIVKSWKGRASNVPVAVESTATFTEFQIKMNEACSMPPNSGVESRISELHFASALAIIRMVNGMIDVEQKGLYSRSVNTVAEDISLPRYFVDLRHRCTHSELPSFERIREAVSNARLWLLEAYWNKQEESLQEHESSLLKQLSLIAKIASSNVDPSIFKQRGEISDILNNVFQSTSVSDFVDIIIPALSGVPLASFSVFPPFVIPNFDAEVVEQSRWADNWCSIFLIAMNRWDGFFSWLLEYFLLTIAANGGDDTTRSWLMCLVDRMMSGRFLEALSGEKKKRKKDSVNVGAILGKLGCPLHRYVEILIRSQRREVVEFCEKSFGACSPCGRRFIVDMTPKEKELLALRKEMCALLKGERIQPNEQMKDEEMLAMVKSLEELENDRPSLWMQGSLLRKESDSLPIGSVLF